jgi:hypothetical protein
MGEAMHRWVILAGLLFCFSLFGSQVYAAGWISGNVASGSSPEFATPAEACSWYFGVSPSLADYVFSHVSSHYEYNGQDVVLPPGRFWCYGVWQRVPDRVWNVGNADYHGRIQDLDGKDENFYNNNATVPDELQELIRKSMRRFYGDQVNQWNIDSKMLKVFQKWISKVSAGCSCFKFVPQPVALPILSASSLVIYFLKYGSQIVREHESEANYSCMLAASIGMKTEFWEAGNL